MAFVGSKGNQDHDRSASELVDPLPPPPSSHPGAQTTGLPDGVEAYTAIAPKRTRILIAGASTLALGAACVYTFLVDPNNPSNAYPQCPLKLFTGIDCPGCGGLRATNALLHGDIMGAADHNVLALVLLPVMAYMFARWVLEQFDVTVPRISWPRAFVWIMPVVLVVFTVARNIPVAGLSWFNSALS